MKRVEFHKNLLNILWLYQQQGIIDITGKKATVPSAIRFLTATFSNSVIMMLAKTGPEDEPINTPSFSLFVRLIIETECRVFLHVSEISFFNVLLLSFVSIKILIKDAI